MSDCNDIKNKNHCELHGFQRNHYFYSQLLTVTDFETEQDYLNGKRNLLNRLIHKPGIVCGFGTEEHINIVSDGEGNRTIEFLKAGLALDGCGHEIIVPQGSKKKITGIETVIGSDKCADIPKDKYMYLYLEYKECLAGSAPAAAGTTCEDEQYCPNRVVEGYEVTASETPPHNNDAPCPDFTGIDNSEDMKEWLHDQLTKECAGQNNSKVFIAALKDDFKIDRDETVKYRSFVYNNQLLGELLTCWISGYGPSQPGRDFYKAVEVKLDSVDKSLEYPIYHGFSCIPVVDVLEKVPKSSTKVNKFIFFLKKSETEEIAAWLGKTETDETEIIQSSKSLENFKETYDKESIVEFKTRFNEYFDKISQEHNVYATRRLQRFNPMYYWARNHVFFIQQPGAEEYKWRKATLDYEILVDEKSVVLKNPKGKKGVIKVVLVA